MCFQRLPKAGKKKTPPSVALCDSLIASTAEALSHGPQTVTLLLYLLHLLSPGLLSGDAVLTPAEAAEITLDFSPLQDPHDNWM